MNLINKILLAAIVAIPLLSAGNAFASQDYDGQLVKFESLPTVYRVDYIEDDQGYWLTSFYNESAFYHYGYSFDDVVEYGSANIGDCPFSEKIVGNRSLEVELQDGMLFKFDNYPNVYWYGNDQVFLIPDEEVFDAQSFSFGNVIETLKYVFADSSNYLSINNIDSNIDATMTSDDILDLSEIDSNFIQLDYSSAIYWRADQDVLFPIPDETTANLLFEDDWLNTVTVNENTLSLFEIEDTISPLSEILYSVDFSGEAGDYPDIGFYSRYGKHNATSPTWYNGYSRHVEQNGELSDVLDVENNRVILVNPSVITKQSDYYSKYTSTAEGLNILGSEEYLYDEAFGIDLLRNELEILDLEAGETHYVQFDIYYTGEDEIGIGLGHELNALGTTIDYMEEIIISKEDGWITIGLEFIFAEHPTTYGSSEGIMLYFGNVDPRAELQVGYIALYK